MNRATARSVHAWAARNLAAWHTSSTLALGLRPHTGAEWWTCPMPAPNVYYSAISVAAARTRRSRLAMADALAAHVRDPANGVVSVCDTWDQLDLRTFGLTRRTVGRWLALEPGGLTPDPAPGGDRRLETLRIEPVLEREALAVFERTMVSGFAARPPIGPFDIHAPGILDDPAMHVFGGWVGDEMVACSMTYVTDVTGVYGVATVPAWRRRGFAAAMTRAAVAAAPDRVAVLQPTAAAGPLYERLGFADIGTFSHWA